MMKILKIIFGFLLAMSSLWVGAWHLGQVEYNHWSAFPAVMTTAIFIMIGGALVAGGVV